MGLFTKKTKTSFKRNQAGKVVRVEHSEEKPKISFKRKKPLYKKMEQQYYQKHPEETKRYKAKKAGGKLLAGIDRMADNYVKNTKKQTKKSSSSKSTRYVIRGGKAYPIARQTKSKKKTRRSNPYSSYDFTNNFNPIGDMFDTGIRAPKKKKKNRGFDPFDNWGFY